MKDYDSILKIAMVDAFNSGNSDAKRKHCSTYAIAFFPPFVICLVRGKKNTTSVFFFNLRLLYVAVRD